MEYTTLIKSRRALRSLKKTGFTKELIREVYDSVKLTPSCFNLQPWRFIFTYEDETLNALFQCLPEGNRWALHASLIVTVLSKKDLDCAMEDGRTYYKLDTGMALFNLILKLTDMGYVAHPIAGYDPGKARDTLNIPDDYEILALVIIGEESEIINSDLTEKQAEVEKKRPERKNFDEVVYLNTFK